MIDHVGLKVKDFKKSVAFYTKALAPLGYKAAALAAGGRDNGAPGPRKDYGPHYYAAFVFDPDGNNVEAVCNDPKG